VCVGECLRVCESVYVCECWWAMVCECVRMSVSVCVCLCVCV